MLDKTRYSEIEKTIHESIFEIAIEEAFELHMFFFSIKCEGLYFKEMFTILV